jgi:hypothetical protein
MSQRNTWDNFTNFQSAADFFGNSTPAENAADTVASYAEFCAAEFADDADVSEAALVAHLDLLAHLDRNLPNWRAMTCAEAAAAAAFAAV